MNQPRFKLDHADIESETWQRIRQWAQGQLGMLRSRNDDVGLDEAQTAALRGQIQQVRNLLDLEKQDGGRNTTEYDAWNQ